VTWVMAGCCSVMVAPVWRVLRALLVVWVVWVALRACSAMAALVVSVLTAVMVALVVWVAGCSVMVVPVVRVGRHWMCCWRAVMVVPAVM